MRQHFVMMALFTLLALGAGCTATPVADATPEPTPETTPETTATTEQVTAVGTVKEFTVSGDNFAFAPSTMTVKKGDTVRVTFVNAEGFHDWKIDELNVATAKLQAGGTETVEFVAETAGSFAYYCSVGTHREMGMEGTLVVTE